MALLKKAAQSVGSGWFGPHMAAASRAIAERIPLVDLVLEVRDARIPFSSEYHQMRNIPSSPKRIIVLNKVDLANRVQVKDWMKYIDQQSCKCYEVNSHNKESIKEFLKFLQAKVKEVKGTNNLGYTATIMLVGIPNVGKSALANILHRIGRISAEEKGKLKCLTVSPVPGETRNISSLKIASHPNIYVLDTPGVLPPAVPDDELCSKLALTGALKDCIEEKELARYFLAILNLSEEHQKWAKFTTPANESDIKLKRQFLSDHTQDVVVQGVRRTLYETISSFDGDLEDEEDLERLIELQLVALHKAFYLPVDEHEDHRSKVAMKLLDLYRTGRLGHYTLDRIPGVP